MPKFSVSEKYEPLPVSISREFMLATSLEGQSAGVDANAGRPLSPRAAQGSPLPVPGAGSVTESQSHSEPIPQIRPHPERIARKCFNFKG